jgi:hypothetical protein
MPRRHDDNDGWTYEETAGVGHFRWRIIPERVDSLLRDSSDVLSDEERALLAEEARDRGMTLLQYFNWVGRLPQPNLYAYRDQIMADTAGPRLTRTYYAWLRIQSEVRLVQMLLHGKWG